MEAQVESVMAGWSGVFFCSGCSSNRHFFPCFSKRSLDGVRYSVLTANMARNWFRDNNFTFLIVFFEVKGYDDIMDGCTTSRGPLDTGVVGVLPRHGESEFHLAEEKMNADNRHALMAVLAPLIKKVDSSK